MQTLTSLLLEQYVLVLHCVTLVMLNILRCHTHFYLSASQIALIQLVDINLHTVITNGADPDQLASKEANRSGSTLFANAEYIRVQQDFSTSS